MDKQESKKLQVHFFRHRARSVSKALWPADMPRSLATGKAAQRRRAFIVKGKWEALLLVQGSQAGVLLPVIALSMFVGGGIVAALFWHLGYILLLPLAILMAGTLLVALPLVGKVSRSLSLSSLPDAGKKHRFPALPGFGTLRTMQRAPETPLPVAPLVRILETFDLSDLSQSNGEHYRDTPLSDTDEDSETYFAVHDTAETSPPFSQMI
jgi:hypothetical protein